MGDWLRERRNALVDGAIIYITSKWLVPEVVSIVTCLAATPTGTFVLYGVAYLLAAVGSIYLTVKLDQPLLSVPSDDKDYVWVYLHCWRPAPHYYMLGSRGTWVRVRRRQDAA